MSNCASCGARLIWVRTLKGKRMPLDSASGRWLEVNNWELPTGPDSGVMSRMLPGRVIRGTFAAADVAAHLDQHDDSGHIILPPGVPAGHEGTRSYTKVYTSHFATCPHAAQHRRAR